MSNLNIVEVTNLMSGWNIEGPVFKDASQYLSSDGDNPEAAQPGYGWPLGTECWMFFLNGYGWRLVATGLTVESAFNRMLQLAKEKKRA